MIERKLDEDKGRGLLGLASLGPLGARLYERHFEANFSYGYEKLAKKKCTQRRNKLSKSNGRQRERRPKLGRRQEAKATGGHGRQRERRPKLSQRNQQEAKATGVHGRPRPRSRKRGDQGPIH